MQMGGEIFEKIAIFPCLTERVEYVYKVFVSLKDFEN